MEFFGNVASKDPYQPSLFELVAQEQLRDLLQPALKYVLSVFAQRYPRHLLRIVNKHEEFYALIMLFIERHYLRKHNASFAENFYGLKRRRRPLFETERANAAVGPDAAAQESKLRRREMRWSLLFLVGIPYIRAKAHDYWEQLGGGVDEEMGGGARRQGEEVQTLASRARYLFKLVYPWANLAFEVWLLGYNVAYLFERTPFYRPWLAWIGVDIRRLGPEDHRSAQAQEGSSANGNRSLFHNLIHRPTGVLLDSLKVLLPLSIFFVKFLEWWYHPSSPARALAHTNTGPAVPPPKMIRPHAKGILVNGEHLKPVAAILVPLASFLPQPRMIFSSVLTTLFLITVVDGLPLNSSHGIVVPTFSALIPFSNNLLNLTKQRARDTSKKSWELGTIAEAYLELDWPQSSVYGTTGVPPPRSVNNNNGRDNISTVLEIANYIIAIRPANISTLFDDSAVGDPPSVGTTVLLANWTKASRPDEAANNYDTPLRSQLSYLLDTAPKTADGAISHRSEQVQLWSDFVYMVPPFIAYYAALSQPYVNGTLLNYAYNQIRLYRNHLFDPSVGLWKHIVLGNFEDNGHWSTGNGWAAAGMLRVLCTINQTTFGNQPQFVTAQRNLQNWATEIVNNIWKYQRTHGAVPNYATDNNTFSDSASTALLASVTYRLAALPVYLRGPNSKSTQDPTITNPNPVINTTNLPPLIPLAPESLQAAHRARNLVWNKLNKTTGWLADVVDPYNFNTKAQESPEAESFVLLMESAWRAWRTYASTTN